MLRLKPAAVDERTFACSRNLQVQSARLATMHSVGALYAASHIKRTSAVASAGILLYYDVLILFE
jgi:hypothetical protein